MERGEENGRTINFSLQMNTFSRDMKKKGFINGGEFLGEDEMKRDVKEEDVELSLGLSMNGRFGLDPSKNKLRRTSSISNFGLTAGKIEDETSHRARGAARETYSPLPRTCSLPTETEDWRHRKVLQSTMSMEARKKRMEKLKNWRLVKDKENSAEDDNIDNGVSSETSDIQSQQAQGTKQAVELKKNLSEPEGSSESLKNFMVNMPFVSTKENGSNGNKVEGFLYRYKKGEEVRILCVCHGLFLSPAEFIKHGGGDDVEHPLKHIVVNPSPLF